MDPHSAVKDAEKALEIDPKFCRAWARKGTAHQMTKEFHKAVDAFEKGLAIDATNKECQDGRMKTMAVINATSGAGGENDEQRTRHAMADPEI
jgi:stress-induced-phosphoprotein 1